MSKKQAVVIHSGGMDSSICLALAIRDFGEKNVLSLSFNYSQRHSCEIKQAKKISEKWRVDHRVVNLECLQGITDNALMSPKKEIEKPTEKQSASTLVVGRNGLMARLGAIHADYLGACCIYLGVIEVEQANCGYRDCSRKYMDLMEKILQIDLGNPFFKIRTPLVKLSKFETLELANELGVLNFLLKETITCYQGIQKLGCKLCPACELRNAALANFAKKYPEISLPYVL